MVILAGLPPCCCGEGQRGCAVMDSIEESVGDVCGVLTKVIERTMVTDDGLVNIVWQL